MSQKKEYHITYKTLAECYGDRLTPEERDKLLQHLESDCSECTELLTRPPEIYQLEEGELESIFKGVERALYSVPSEGKGFKFQSPKLLVEQIKTLLMPAWGFGFSALLLLLLWLVGGDSDRRITQREKLGGEFLLSEEREPWFHKSSCRKAYLLVEVHRKNWTKSKGVLKLAFKSGEDYYIGDVMLFSFLVVRKGYIYLLREDSEGRLEQLYPFRGAPPRFFTAGETYQLERAGVRMGYFLEPALKGYQKLWLLHSDSPVIFPSHIKFLSPQQREIFKCGELIDFFVRERRK